MTFVLLMYKNVNDNINCTLLLLLKVYDLCNNAGEFERVQSCKRLELCEHTAVQRTT